MRQVVNVMKITLYNNISAAERAYKTVSTITGGINISITPTDDMSILSPTVILNYNTNFLNANYCYIDTFKRYYFITGRAVTVGKRIVISCSVDALSTWISGMTNNAITVTRNENIGINKMPDSKLPILPNVKEITSTILSSNFFTKTDANSYLLSVIGGE